MSEAKTYNLKISGAAATRLRKKAEEKGLDLSDYLRNLIAFAETLDDLSDENTQIVMHKSKSDPKKELTIPVRALKHG